MKMCSNKGFCADYFFTKGCNNGFGGSRVGLQFSAVKISVTKMISEEIGGEDVRGEEFAFEDRARKVAGRVRCIGDLWGCVGKI